MTSKLFNEISRAPGATDSFLMYDASKDRAEWRKWIKTIYVPFTSGTLEIQKGPHTGWEIDFAAEVAYARLYIPDDFGTLLTAEVTWIALAATAAMAWDVVTNWGCNDEAYNGTADALSFVFTGTPTADDLYKSNIAAALTGIAAGDIVGLNIVYKTNTDGMFLGVKLTYEVSI